MSLLSPTSQAEVKQLDWLVAAFFVFPYLPLFALWWSAFPSARAHWLAFGGAVALSIPFSVWAVRRRNRLVELGMHTHYSKTRPMRIREYLHAWLGLLLGLYWWNLATLVVLVWLPSHALSEQAFIVTEAKQCTRKCLVCYREAKLSSWPGTSIGSVCIEGIDPTVRPGERLIVSGRFSSFGVYVQSIRRANAD